MCISTSATYLIERINQIVFFIMCSCFRNHFRRGLYKHCNCHVLDIFLTVTKSIKCAHTTNTIVNTMTICKITISSQNVIYKWYTQDSIWLNYRHTNFGRRLSHGERAADPCGRSSPLTRRYPAPLLICN